MSLSAVTKRPVRGGSTPRIMEMTGRKSHTAVGDQVPNQFEDSPNTVMGEMSTRRAMVCSAHAEVIPRTVLLARGQVGLLRTRGGDPYGEWE